MQNARPLQHSLSCSVAESAPKNGSPGESEDDRMSVFTAAALAISQRYSTAAPLLRNTARIRFLLSRRKLPKLSLPIREVMVASQLLPVGMLISGTQHMPEASKIPPEDIYKQQKRNNDSNGA